MGLHTSTSRLGRGGSLGTFGAIPFSLDVSFSGFSDSAALAAIGDQLGASGLYRIGGNIATGAISSGHLTMAPNNYSAMLGIAAGNACQSFTADAYFTEGAPDSGQTWSVAGCYDPTLNNFLFVEFGKYGFGARMSVGAGEYLTSQVTVDHYDGLTYDSAAQHRMRLSIAPGLYPYVVVSAELRNMATDAIVASHSGSVNRDAFRRVGQVCLRGGGVNGNNTASKYERFTVTTNDSASLASLFPAGTIKVLFVGDSNRNFSLGLGDPNVTGTTMEPYKSALATASGKTVFILNPSNQGLWIDDYGTGQTLGDYVRAHASEYDIVDVALITNSAWTSRRPAHATYAASLASFAADMVALGKRVVIQEGPYVDVSNGSVPVVFDASSAAYISSVNGDLAGVVTTDIKRGSSSVYSTTQTNKDTYLTDGAHYSATGGAAVAILQANSAQAQLSL